jgi:hypothetical protein
MGHERGNEHLARRIVGNELGLEFSAGRLNTGQIEHFAKRPDIRSRRDFLRRAQYWVPAAPDDFALEILCLTASMESLSPAAARLHPFGTTPDCHGAEDAIRGTGPQMRRRLASEFAQLIGTFTRFLV